jgi:hypothetical protein
MRRLSALALGLLAAIVVAGPADADVSDLRPGRWSGGAGVGFLTGTPDGVEFAASGHVDYFLTGRVSVGALGQFAGGGNDSIFGVSAQVKYWWDIPGTRNRLKLVVQGGIGFVGADIEDSDSGASDTDGSFLIPVGVGLDYAVARKVAVTATFLLNFTSLGDTVRVQGREIDLHTNVMPGFYLGVRF